jgi:hypothetical protein
MSSSERLVLFDKYITDAIEQLPSTYDSEDVSIFVCQEAKKYGLESIVQLVAAERMGITYAYMRAIVYDASDANTELMYWRE